MLHFPGENGAAKSTIMKVLVGVNTKDYRPCGTEEEEIVCTDIEEQRRRGIGWSIVFGDGTCRQRLCCQKTSPRPPAEKKD